MNLSVCSFWRFSSATGTTMSSIRYGAHRQRRRRRFMPISRISEDVSYGSSILRGEGVSAGRGGERKKDTMLYLHGWASNENDRIDYTVGCQCMRILFIGAPNCVRSLSCTRAYAHTHTRLFIPHEHIYHLFLSTNHPCVRVCTHTFTSTVVAVAAAAATTMSAACASVPSSSSFHGVTHLPIS